MKFIYLIFFLLFIHVEAQTSTNGLVTYQQTKKDFTGTHISTYNLYFNKKHSVYLYDEDENKDVSGYNSTGMFADLIPETTLESPYYYRLLTAKDVIYNEPSYSKQYIVKDDAINFIWKIHNEKRTIGNYQCNKATTEFRGRNYTAWFTNQIPVDYGPYKFFGLPGLILEISDDQDVFSVYASDIRINSSAIDIDAVIENIDLKVDMNYHEFLDNRCNDAIDFNKKLEAKMGRDAGRFSNVTVGSEENIEVDFQECEE